MSSRISHGSNITDEGVETLESKKLAVEVRRKCIDDDEWVQDVLKRYWYSTKIISKGRVHNADQLSGFIARQSDARVGLVLYEISTHECEIVSLNSFTELSGVGSLLIDSVKSAAMDANCRRIWLITTNDNTLALRFYQRKGFVLAALYPNAIQQSRKLKPEIPITGHDGIPIRDEIELEMLLQ